MFCHVVVVIIIIIIAVTLTTKTSVFLRSTRPYCSVEEVHYFTRTHLALGRISSTSTYFKQLLLSFVCLQGACAKKNLLGYMPPKWPISCHMCPEGIKFIKVRLEYTKYMSFPDKKALNCVWREGELRTSPHPTPRSHCAIKKIRKFPRCDMWRPDGKGQPLPYSSDLLLAQMLSTSAPPPPILSQLYYARWRKHDL